MNHYAIRSNPMSFSGEAIKKLLPTMEFPKIDILVRESIQNSFDAIEKDADCLRFSFKHGVFETKKFASELEDMEGIINQKYPSNKSEFIEVRDRNTKGLGGPTVFSENHEEWGNYIRLVFAVANKQTGIGKGGSWGYGKTNYYSLGNGIVIYYTQTVFEGKKEQRLIIALVEDTSNKDCMLYPAAKLGISYWGADCIGDNNVLPCTDSKKIQDLLQIFGLKPFEEEETGTSITIPFVNCQNLYLDSAYSIMEESKIEPYSEKMFEFIVKLSVQRWYFPRLLNEQSKQFLSFEYNGAIMSKDEMFELFEELQDIYNETITKPYYISLSQAVFRGKDTKMATYSSRLIKSSIINPYNLTVHQMVGVKNNTRPNAAIGFRCRSLGMINKYNIDNEFVSNVDEYDPSKILVVGLRPLPEVMLYDPADNQRELTSLEEYIRKGEDPTHSTWKDSFASDFRGVESPRGLQVIQQMLIQLHRVFERKEDRAERQQKRNLAISRAIGKILLPETGYGTGATTTGGNGGGGNGGRKPRPRPKDPVSYENPVRKNEGDKIHITFPFVLSDSNKVFTIKLAPCVEEIKTIGEWENKCGIPFPVSIESFKITTVNGQPLTTDEPVVEGGSVIVDGINIQRHFHNSRVVALTFTHPPDIRQIEVELLFDQSACKFKTNIDVVDGGYNQ